MNWGWKIALLFSGFVLFILFLVFKSVQQDFYLVSKDYYKQEIEYQKVIDGMKNAQLLGDEFDVKYDIKTQILKMFKPFQKWRRCNSEFGSWHGYLSF